MAKQNTTQEWINRIVLWTITTLEQAGVSNPDLHLVVSPGFTSGGSRKTKVLGQCYSPECAADGKTNHVFLNPRMNDNIVIIGAIIHEVIHAVIGIDKKHGAAFKSAMAICNLTGKATSTKLNEAGLEWAKKIITRYGDYPRPSFTGAAIKKQTTNLIKAQCPSCGYIIRLTNKWIEFAHPQCPSGNCDCDMIVG